MNYIIFDMEWNQPLPQESVPELRHGEIIQIGFFVLDDSLEIIYREQVNIKPVCYKVMNRYVSALTGITQSDIDKGTDFVSALRRMELFFTDDTVIMTWGDDDMPLLKDNLSYHGFNDYSLPPHYNLQRIYALQTGTNSRQTGLSAAAESLGISVDLHAHEALNDAYVTVLIAKKLDLVKGIAEYSTVIKEKHKGTDQPWLSEPVLSESRTDYSGTFDGMAAHCRKQNIFCPVCGKPAEMTELCRQGKMSFISSFECREHGEFFVRYELKEGRITIRLYAMNDTFKRIYINRLKGREKRLRYKEMCAKAASMRRGGQGRGKRRK